MMKKSSPPRKFSVLAADVALITFFDEKVLVRLMDVDRPPFFAHVPGLPGGLVLPHETAEETALRLVSEKGALNSDRVHLEQLQTYSAIDRDPRGRVVSVAYLAFVPWAALSEKDRANTKTVWWEDVRAASKQSLAYDHNTILHDAVLRIRDKIRYTTIAGKLLPHEFTITDLRHIYETILEKPVDKRNFIKKIRTLDVLEPVGRKSTGHKSRPAELFRFVSKKVIVANMF